MFPSRKYQQVWQENQNNFAFLGRLPWEDSVVPFWTYFEWFEGEVTHCSIRDCDACWIEPGIEVGLYCESSLGLGCRNEIEDFVIGFEGYPLPAFADFAKEPVFDGVPFGGTGGVVSDSDDETVGVTELHLEVVFPGS